MTARSRRKRRSDRSAIWLLAVGSVVAIMLFVWAWARKHPQDMPWTRVELTQPVGLFTGRKLVALTRDFPACRAALDRADVRYNALPALRVAEKQCGYSDGVRLIAGGLRSIGFSPARLGMACPVAAALTMWEREVVQPAALRHFGQRVVTIDHFGSYNCRRLYGRDTGTFSQHATADALDVAGFRLADGTRISLVGDWSGSSKKAAFLRDVHDGACDLFATVLGPDYNAAHRDHFHIDQANRAMGWRVCR